MRYKGIVEALERDGVYVSTIVGYSMWPMLRNRRDTIVIEPLASEVKYLDVVLYQVRADSFVLHRIIGETGNQWIIRGDNNLNKEWIDKDKILGKAVSFYRGERYFTMESPLYRYYSHLWCDTPVIKYLFIYGRRYGSALVRRVCKKKK